MAGLDDRQRPEAVVFDLKEELGMVERLRDSFLLGFFLSPPRAFRYMALRMSTIYVATRIVSRGKC
jgi:hypothetical protein